MISENR